MRRALAPLVAAGVLLVAGVAVVVALTSTTFSAGSFVRVYLDALARGDVRGALDVPGVMVPNGAAEDLLDAAALPDLGDIREVSSTELDGVHVVVVTWSSGGVAGSSRFEVERTGTLWGLFPEWRFATSPIATLDLTVLHDPMFSVGGVGGRAAGPDPQSFAVLVPGTYPIDHVSRFLEAQRVDAVVDTPGVTVPATLDVQPTPALLEQIESDLHARLDGCAKQEVLFPTGCPIGHAISNRVVSAPTWSIVTYPDVSVLPGDEYGTWEVPPTPFTAHLTVQVQSLFDGAVTTFDDDVPLEVACLVRIQPDGRTVQIVVQD